MSGRGVDWRNESKRLIRETVLETGHRSVKLRRIGFTTRYGRMGRDRKREVNP
jgi:hypothetical protein